MLGNKNCCFGRYLIHFNLSYKNSHQVFATPPQAKKRPLKVAFFTCVERTGQRAFLALASGVRKCRLRLEGCTAKKCKYYYILNTGI